MLLALLVIAAGVGLLLVGADLLVRGASTLALRARVAPAVVGLTVVAAGASLPELAVAVSAGAAGAPALALGSVMGSSIYNIALILGLTAAIRPLQATSRALHGEWPLLALSTGLLHLLCRDGSLDRIEGAFLLAGLLAYGSWLVRLPGPEADRQAATLPEGLPRSWVGGAGQVLLGSGLLAAGGQGVLAGALAGAAELGAPERVAGLVLAAAGTSLPELAASAAAAWRGKADLAVGAIAGSNLVNILGVLGLTALVQPLAVPLQMLRMDSPWLIGLTLLLLPLMHLGKRVYREDGFLLLAAGGVYAALLVVGVR